MPEFILDTAGRVECADPHKPCVCHAATWEQLDSFVQGYIEALFFTECSPAYSSEEWLTPACMKAQEEGQADGTLPGDAGFSDLSAGALQSILTDCARFQESAAWRALEAAREAGEDAPDDEHAGRDFWYTRNGHGCGFWDGDWPEPHATALSDAAREFGEVNPDFGSDSKVYLM